MSAIENIYKTLSRLKIYDLKAKYINAELCAYNVGLSYIENKIDEILKSVFVFLGEDVQLKEFERLLCLPASKNSNIENRRDMICNRLSITKNDYTKEGLTKAIRSVGFDATIQELPEIGKIKIINKGFLNNYDSLDEIKKAMVSILPSHLDFEIDMGLLTWDMFDKKYLTFSELDENDFSWEQFDLNGHRLKGGKDNAEQI